MTNDCILCPVEAERHYPYRPCNCEKQKTLKDAKRHAEYDADRYCAYEIRPCLLLDIHGRPVKNDDPNGMYYEQCDEDNPDIAVWTLYGHPPDGELECIDDYATKDEAEMSLQKLLGHEEKPRKAEFHED